MTLTPSTMLELETQAPDFRLPDVVSGQTISLASFEDKTALLVMFICCHCPFVKHIEQEIAQMAKDYQHKSLGMIAISSNDASKYPDDSPENMKLMAQKLGFNFPFCYDETQEVAKLYTAACTPDFFLYNDSRKLVYRGQLDDSRPSNQIPVTGTDLRQAIDCLLAQGQINLTQKPSIGCNIKWKPGNEPEYFA
ncbi:Peroxiredoxin [Xenococcus sp. PCC 7305]|uniref:thioredoxin family protein n=1 Tax=Xenococcus sp. PCC 7305 TaxID=102125 RepID=UPI0002ABA0C7|nr:thioredoxin family protein [Xenococcus sp. PCC 7305]ELS03218.1 Peroxiredoxin [Xenococcus sp. PCC 7305]